ncbi:MAG: nucleoside phosphorylase [Caldiserica bacterium]|jgi:uridine phosphorylase|nr:nucleoside phosphorylase [Caldisericota bacterium]MDH7563209.1 nucleoside phosphorylase [Caldisericota bacterium]
MVLDAKPPDFDRGNRPLFTGINPSDVGKYVIFTVRDPLHGYSKDAAEEISDYLVNSRKIADTKMFTTYSGFFENVLITVCSTGSGAPELELVLMDFIKWSTANTFIRVGTSGALQRFINIGDIVISTGAVRDEGTSGEYVAKSFPAISSFEVVLAMASAAEELKIPYHLGITRSNDAIYVGEGRPAKNYLQELQKFIPNYWEKAGVLNVERETSLLLTLCNIFNKRGGAVCTIVDNELTGEVGVGAGKKDSILVALKGLSKLARWDKAKEQNGKRYLDEKTILVASEEGQP